MVSPDMLNYITQIKGAYSEDLQQVFNLEQSLRENAKTLMHNLALISGTLATGALILLGVDIPSDKTIIIIGVIALFINVLLVFFYLFHQHGKAIHEFYEFKKKTISPVAALLIMYADLEADKITEIEFKAELLKVAQDRKKYVENNNIQISQESKPKDRWDSVFIILLALGFIFIVGGLVSPYL